MKKYDLTGIKDEYTAKYSKSKIKLPSAVLSLKSDGEILDIQSPTRNSLSILIEEGFIAVEYSPKSHSFSVTLNLENDDRKLTDLSYEELAQTLPFFTADQLHTIFAPFLEKTPKKSKASKSKVKTPEPEPKVAPKPMTERQKMALFFSFDFSEVANFDFPCPKLTAFIHENFPQFTFPVGFPTNPSFSDIFNVLNESLAQQIIEKVKNSKDLLWFMASFVSVMPQYLSLGYIQIEDEKLDRANVVILYSITLDKLEFWHSYEGKWIKITEKESPLPKDFATSYDLAEQYLKKLDKDKELTAFRRVIQNEIKALETLSSRTGKEIIQFWGIETRPLDSQFYTMSVKTDEILIDTGFIPPFRKEKLKIIQEYLA